MHLEHSSPAYAGPMWLVIYEFHELNNKKGFRGRHLLELVRSLSLEGSPEKLGLCDGYVVAELWSLKSGDIRANGLCCSSCHLWILVSIWGDTTGCHKSHG